MKTEYFVILGSPDGGCSVEKMTKKQIQAMLVPNEYGDFDYGERKVLTELPEDVCDFEDMVIIKGSIVVPQPKTTVQEYDIP